jgi:tetratricopeptide (TPR) repeat protein
MPFSSESGKEDIKWVMSKIKPLTGIDIGCGCGTYAKLFPEVRWDGVEIWQPYVDKYALPDLYKSLYVQDAITWVPDKQYDVAIAGDVLEHMTAEQAAALITKLKACAKTVVISIPIGHYPQGEYEGNPYERHVSDNWSVEAVKAAFGDPTWSHVAGEIGVFAYSDQPIRLKIAVYAISKNEEKHAERFAKSAQKADLIFVADTGSTDQTVPILQANGVTVGHIFISPWRFDDARNAALAMLPQDIDVCLSMDLDEVLQDGWREEVERVWVPGITRMQYKFDWGVGIVFYYQKTHARRGYRWHHPCHEYPVPDRLPEKWAYSEKLLIVHKPDPEKSRGQYLDLLRISIEEDPRCPRNAFYYARELSFTGQWEQAIKECERYLALPGANWANERCYAMRVIGRAYQEMGNFEQALAWFRRATSEAPATREPWNELALCCYLTARWPECFGAALTCISITKREDVYTVDPAVWGSQPHDLAAIAAWNLKLYDLAKKHAKDALDLAPDDLRLRRNLEAISADAA